MNTYTKKLLGACVAASLPAFAHAALYHVQITGVVDFNVIAGDMNPVPDGAPVSMGFNVDSTVFTNSASFPTRGYSIIVPSFSMTVGGVPVNMDNPQPAPAYFVLRNNDPAVDGFFMSTSVENTLPLTVHIPGLSPAHELDFLVTYPNTATLSSLNIADAVGSYAFAGISVYNWAIGRFSNHGAEYIYSGLTISAVPEPAAGSLLGLGLLLVLGRTGAARREQASRAAAR